MILNRVTQSTLFRQFATSVNSLQQQIAQAEEQVSTQKKLQSASDDPAGAAQANRLTTQTRALAAVSDGIGFGNAVLSAQDSALEQTNTCSRARARSRRRRRADSSRPHSASKRRPR